MPTVVDTVVLHYFLVADRAELLLELLDPPVGVPRIVFDPEDDDGRDIGVSEIRRNIRYEQRLANEAVPDDGDDSARELEDARASATTNLQRLGQIEHLIAGGRIQVLDLTGEEQDLSAQLASSEPDPALGLLIALDDGEAACVAIAIERGWTLATDDTDALRVLHRRAPNHPYERIRRLLSRGVNDGHITEAEANDIHAVMTRAGFWDRTRPFPEP